MNDFTKILSQAKELSNPLTPTEAVSAIRVNLHYPKNVKHQSDYTAPLQASSQ